MNDNTKNQEQIAAGIQPVFVPYYVLHAIMEPLHMNDKAWTDKLHDVWRAGVCSPDSIILDVKKFDERGKQTGNNVKRLLMPNKLASWMVECSAARGIPFTMDQALDLARGRSNYGAGLVVGGRIISFPKGD